MGKPTGGIRVKIKVIEKPYSFALIPLIFRLQKEELKQAIKKETLVFSGEFCEISKNSFSYRTLPVDLLVLRLTHWIWKLCPFSLFFQADVFQPWIWFLFCLTWGKHVLEFENNRCCFNLSDKLSPISNTCLESTI